jgi:hypothetical protein
MQSGPASHAKFKALANEITAHQSSEPSVLNKRFIIGVIHGLLLSAIFWILLAETSMRFTR